MAEAERDWKQAIHWYRAAQVTAALDPLISASIEGSLLRVEKH